MKWDLENIWEDLDVSATNTFTDACEHGMSGLGVEMPWTIEDTMGALERFVTGALNAW